MVFNIDVDENNWSKEVFSQLLTDKTTNRNIIWATSDYETVGLEYGSQYPILYENITGANSDIIKPRVLKSKENQGNRTKDKAEVFTPSWVCNYQNNLIDESWFGRENVFNIGVNQSWSTVKEKIEFPKVDNKSWQDYVNEKRLEITCGEAPYLVSRYDSVTGNPIELNDRIGLLDRKMRVVAENTDSEMEWINWSKKAFESIYGFEFQGDSLLLARENLLATYVDYYRAKLDRNPTDSELLDIATIISWNIWQMDGLKFTIPYQTVRSPDEQLSFLDSDYNQTEKFCIIKDWITNEIFLFKDLVNK